MTRWLVVAVLGCGSGSGSPPPVAPAATDTVSTGGTPTTTACAAVRPKVLQLAHANAAERAPKRADELAADNAAMVMADCATSPAKLAACITSAATFPEIEAHCLVPIDDEGTEGDRLAK